VFTEEKDDGDGSDNWTTGAVSRAKLQSNCHHQQTNIQFYLQAGFPSCHPTNSVKALKGKYHISWTCLPHNLIKQIYLSSRAREHKIKEST